MAVWVTGLLSFSGQTWVDGQVYRASPRPVHIGHPIPPHRLTPPLLPLSTLHLATNSYTLTRPSPPPYYEHHVPPRPRARIRAGLARGRRYPCTSRSLFPAPPTRLISRSHFSILFNPILLGALPRQEPRVPKSPHRRPDPRAYHPVPSHLGRRPGSAPGQPGLPSAVQLGFGTLQGWIEVAPQCQLEHLEVVSLWAVSVSCSAELLLTSVFYFSSLLPLPPLQPRIRADLQERPYRSQHGRWKGRMRL